jgi:Skp family chaperone for outer membrane proteins
MTLVLMLGSFGALEHSLPGDLLYSVRSAFHKAQTALIPEQEKPAYQLKLANDRLDDLAKAPAKNLAPTISEFQANISEAAKELVKMDATTSDPVMMRKIVDASKKINENKQKVESLGVIIGDEKETEEWNNAMKKVVGDVIKDLETRTLAEEKQEILEEMKKMFEEGKYSESLEFYLVNQ